MSRGPYTCTQCGEDCTDSGCVNLACPIGYHNVKTMRPTMLDEDEHADPIEHLQTSADALGRVCTLEEFAGQLRKMSGEAFANGKDEVARVYRDLAETQEKVAKHERMLYNHKYRGM